MLFALLKGFALSASLIVVIGAQNAFVIRQGIMHNLLFLTAFLCSFIDAVLIAFGVLGLGEIITSYPILLEGAKYFAVVFLFIYGCFSLKEAFSPHVPDEGKKKKLPSVKKTILTILALSLLNPHAYFDAVILGSIGSQQPLEERIYFTVGAITASFIWFFALTYGSRFLAPLLHLKNSWKVIDAVSGGIMWAVALSLLI